MILNRLDEAASELVGPAWTAALDFLRTLPPDAAEQRYVIQGDDVYATVMSYATKAPEEARLETHDVYVDVQFLLAGSERIAWQPRAGLTPTAPYDAEKDISFYREAAHTAPAQVRLSPGLVAIFAPADAHAPGIRVGGRSATVRKVVVKIRAALV